MAASLLRTGGVAQIPNTVSATAPSVLYDSNGAYTGVADMGACEAYKITNLDSTNWLFIAIPGMHVQRNGSLVVPYRPVAAGTWDGTMIAPGETLTLINGFNSNDLQWVLAWATAPTVGGAAATCNVGGGFHKKN